MFRLAKPSRDVIRAFLSAQSAQPFSYPEVGCSREQAPSGYVVDCNRIKLGQGLESFERAKNAMKQWKMFDIPWITLCWPDTPIGAGVTLAVLVSHLGFWSLNACRIVYVIEEHAASKRCGFAYGTLRQHAEVGEERFTVEYALSRPRTLPRLGYPYTRALQKRFARDSKISMQRSIRSVVGA